MPPFDSLVIAILLACQTPANGPKPQTPAKASEYAPKSALLTANPNPALPGQIVTFHWPDTKSPVELSGGGFGTRKLIKGQTWAKDRPAKTTTYALVPIAESSKSSRGKKSNPPAGRSTVTVDIYPGKFPWLGTYVDSRGWSIDVIGGWNRYVVDLEDKGNNALIYFQPVEDSAERVAVSQLPVPEMTAGDLMRKVETEIPTQYDMLTVLERKETTHAGFPAAWMVFTGTEISHPDTPTKSIVMAFVQGLRGYVVSARTTASRFAESEKMLRCLVRSFNPIGSSGPRPIPKPAPPAKP